MDWNKPVDSKILALPAIVKMRASQVDYERARLAQRDAERKAFAVLRRKGWTEDDARALIRRTAAHAAFVALGHARKL